MASMPASDHPCLRCGACCASFRVDFSAHETQALGGREIELKDKAILRWTDSMDTMVVTFGEVASGSRTGPVKRQFWARRGKHWQIIYEGVIG